MSRARKGSPSQRWNHEHRGSNKEAWKVALATRQEAVERADYLTRRWDDGNVRAAYECRWGADYRDGEAAPVHWHVGRKQGAGWL